ncbi:MAG: 4-(cytidine 5'-diphospho)-2-C-methyl-D-erythritol kinase [Sedimenticola sp.]|nr:MAG: 4-(cytidine 5'-diphospho)-2-C-methyl-D-erythritol kinase [Sedimenticola sp.]
MVDLPVWPAPAKLNLMLRIVGRRSDGYHLLQTVFQFLDICDYLTFFPTDDGQISRRNALAGVPEDADLVVRAARLLQQKRATRKGVEISLDKRLPMGGGLGGGSSDAATTLVALNQLWGLGLSVDQLAGMGLALGADVPVFVRGFAAWAEGVGEKLQPIDIPEPWYLILVPDCQVSTGEVFGDPELTRDSERITIRDFLAGTAVNDCLDVVCRRYPPVAEAVRWLNEHARARLTGTGACVFAMFDRQSDAIEVQRQLAAGVASFVAQGRNRSPLLEVAQR